MVRPAPHHRLDRRRADGPRQHDSPLQTSPHPFPAERLELPHQRRRSAGMDTAAVDRPRTTTPTQQPNPTPAHPTATQSATTREGCMNEAGLPAMAHRYQPVRTHHVPDTAAVPAPGQNVAGAQERSRCSPLRRNDLDRSEHRHTIDTAGTAARRTTPKDQDEH